MEKTRSPVLYVVATPIGNLGDLSARAVDTLRSVAAIYCEDTRVTARLTARFAISTPRISCHEHNEVSRVGEALARLRAGEDLALVSDAGTPAISDPGEKIAAAVAAAGFRVVPVPGACATAAALSISGFAAVPHTFLGFPPPRPAARRRFFAEAARRMETLVWYEAPHRLPSSLRDAAQAFGNRPAMLARELTKIYEETVRGSLVEISAEISRRGRIAGECVIVVGPGNAAGHGDQKPVDLIAEADRLSAEGQSPRQIARELSRRTGVHSRDLYRSLIDRKK